MQFITYQLMDPTTPAAPPSPQVLADLAALTAEGFKEGWLVSTGGLPPMGSRLHNSVGKFTVTDAPMIEAKELMGGFAIIRAKSLDEAIEMCKRFRLLIGDGVSEIVQIYGPD